MKHALILVVSILGCGKPNHPPQSAEQALPEATNRPVARRPPKASPQGDRDLDTRQAPTDEATKLEPAELEAIKPPPRPTVVLLRAGRRPRMKLRFALEKEQTAQLELLTDMAIGLFVEGNALPKNALPTMKSVLELEITEASGDSFGFDWQVREYEPLATSGVQPEVMAAMKAQLATLVGVKGTSKMDSRGFNLGGTFLIPSGTSPSVRMMMEGMRDALAKMAAPMPEQAIGVNGKWKVSQRVTQNGVTNDFEVIYTVKRIRKTKRGVAVTFDTKILLNGVPGPMDNTDLPRGTTMKLDSSKGGGSGQVTLNLSSLVPVRSDTSISSQANMTASSNGQTQRIGNSVKIRVKMRGI